MAVQKGWGKNLGMKGPDAADVVGQLFSELLSSQSEDLPSLPEDLLPEEVSTEAACTEALKQLSEIAPPPRPSTEFLPMALSDAIEPPVPEFHPTAAHPERSEPVELPQIPEVVLDENIFSVLDVSNEFSTPIEPVIVAPGFAIDSGVPDSSDGWLHSAHEAVVCETPEAVAEPVPVEPEPSAAASEEPEAALHQPFVDDLAFASASITRENETLDEPQTLKAPPVREHTPLMPRFEHHHDRGDSGELDAVIKAIDAQVAKSPLEVNFGGRRAEREIKGRNTTPWIVFTLAGTRYAVPIHQVTETDTIPAITPVPYLPPFVRGVTNLRGEIITVLDLRSLLGLEDTGRFERGRMLVVRVGEQQTIAAMVVDEVRGIDRFDQKDLVQVAGTINDRVAPLLLGTFEHEDRVLNVLDLERLFQSTEMRQLTAA